MADKDDPIRVFETERAERINHFGQDKDFITSSRKWLYESMKKGYTYNFSWLGRPIIQYPTDLIALQEIIWLVKPDLIIETGIAHGGSLLFNASMLAILEVCEITERNASGSSKSKKNVLGIDIDIRPHNRKAIEAHPLSCKIDMIQGDSIEPATIEYVHNYSKEYKNIFVCLDSNHTHEHVLSELEAYAPLISRGSYCVIFDTFIEDMTEDIFPDRPWGKNNNPKTAVIEYMRRLKHEGRTAADGSRLDLEIDRTFENKSLITSAPDGFLKRL